MPFTSPRRRFRSILALTALLATVAMAMPGAPASAAVDAAAVKGALDAIKQLAQHVPAFQSGSQPLPRIDDNSDGAKLLRAVWNTDAVVAGRPQLAAGTPDLMAWGETANAVMKLYIFAGGANTPEALAANEARYRKEIAHGSAFAFRMSGTTMQGVMDHMAALPKAEAGSPNRQDGFKQVAGGLRNQVLGMLGLIGKTEGEDAPARLMAGALADDIGLLSQMFGADARREMADAALQAVSVQVDPVVKEALARFEKACRPQ